MFLLASLARLMFFVVCCVLCSLPFFVAPRRWHELRDERLTYRELVRVLPVRDQNGGVSQLTQMYKRAKAAFKIPKSVAEVHFQYWNEASSSESSSAPLTLCFFRSLGFLDPRRLGTAGQLRMPSAVRG